jgi:metal-responsive CopG/Arc/MetJ family transcriptional regulator
MQRTQIYFEQPLLEELKQQAKMLGISMSAYIRQVMQEDLHKRKQQKQNLDLSQFAGIWKDNEISQESIREKAWK